MPDVSPLLGLPYLLPSQAQKHVTHNEALALLDAVVQLVVAASDLATPPVSPVDGDRYIVAPGGTSAWQGHDGHIAVWRDSGWHFAQPLAGWQAHDLGSGNTLRFDGSGWVVPPLDLANLDGVGIGTGWDSTNRLAVSATASLLSHDGAGHQLKINKASTADTASLLFQTGWSGRAEMGTAGNDRFAIKTSADGTAWVEALSFDGASGVASGMAVQQSRTDITAGRLMRADYGYGPGNLLGTVSSSGGIPTGAVIERGSNANGEYVRFADGTQICSHTLTAVAVSTSVNNGALYSSIGLSWTFPANFVYGTVQNRTGRLLNASSGVGVHLPYGSNTSCTGIKAYATASVASTDLNLLAIGRWI